MDITPRPFGEQLTFGMAVLGRVWKRLVPSSFAAFVVLGAAGILVFQAYGALEFVDIAVNRPAALETMSDSELLQMAQDFLVAFGIILLLQMVASSYVSLVAFRVVGAELAGKECTAGQAAVFAARKSLTYILVVLASIVAIVAGLILLIAPGIWIGVKLSMAGPVIAMEGAGVTGALGRSFRLVTGRWWPTIGWLVFTGLLGGVAAQLVQLVAVPLLAIGSLGIGAGLSFGVAVVVQGFIVAAIAVMVAVWYVDLRVRQEKFPSESLG
jgi:hypothetical protein